MPKLLAFASAGIAPRPWPAALAEFEQSWRHKMVAEIERGSA